MRILVTGGAGFVGQHVVRALSHDGHDVIVVDIEPVPAGAPGLHVRSDLRHWIPPVDSGFEAVVHLAAFGGVARAAREPRFIFESNTLATSNLVALCRAMTPPPRFIHVSSFSVYGRNAGDVKLGTSVDPLETYAASKLAQELALIGAPFPVTVFRCSSMYGRGMRLEDNEATVIAKMAGAIARGDEFPIYEDGQQRRDFLHVGDLVEAVGRLLVAPPGDPEIVNACSGKSVSLLEMAQRIGAAMGKGPRLVMTGETRPGDMRHCKGDAWRFEQLLGRATTPFASGVYKAFGS